MPPLTIAQPNHCTHITAGTYLYVVLINQGLIA